MFKYIHTLHTYNHHDIYSIPHAHAQASSIINHHQHLGLALRKIGEALFVPKTQETERSP